MLTPPFAAIFYLASSENESTMGVQQSLAIAPIPVLELSAILREEASMELSGISSVVMVQEGGSPVTGTAFSAVNGCKLYWGDEPSDEDPLPDSSVALAQVASSSSSHRGEGQNSGVPAVRSSYGVPKVLVGDSKFKGTTPSKEIGRAHV